MKTLLTLLLIGGLSFAADDLTEALQVTDYPYPSETPSVVLIKGATVWTMEGDGVIQADVLLKDGKINRIRKNIKAPKGAMVIEAEGMHVTPGLVDCHSHSAVEGFGVNEGTNSITAEVRIRDVLDHRDPNIYRQLSGGLTSANVLHGSANAIGGQNAVVKWRWGCEKAHDLLIETAPEGIKFALGENPKRSAFNALPIIPPRYPATRMGVESIIRDTFQRASDYKAKWDVYNGLSDEARASTPPPRRDLQLDAIAEIMAKERLVHSHGYRSDEFLALLRTMEDYDVQIATLQHVLEGYKIADEIAKHGAGGSTFSDWWAFKVEAYDAIPYNAALMEERGVLVSVNSDDGNLARRMNLEAAKTIRYGGVDPINALAMVTINPAKQLRIDDRTGSLKKGKDADVVIWSGDPLSIFSVVEMTFVDGQLLFSREADKAHQETIAKAREVLIAHVKDGKKAKTDGEDKGDDAKDAASEDGEAEEKTEEAEAEADEAEEDAEEIKPVIPAPKKGYTPDPYSGNDSFAVVGATVHTISGDVIENGVVVVRDGKIAAVGGSDTSVPSGMDTVDGKGKHLWPGIIHAFNNLGLEEISSISATMDVSETGDFNPDIRAQVAVHPDSALIPVARSAGITHALTIAQGGIITGSAALIRTQGWTWEEMTGSDGVVMGLSWPEGRASGFAAFFSAPRPLKERKQEAEKKVKEIDAFMEKVLAYQTQRENAANPVAVNKLYDYMLPVMAGEMPLMIFAQEAWAVEAAVKWAGKWELPIVIVGAQEAAQQAEFLAKHKVPVILTTVLNDPTRTDHPYHASYGGPAKLAEAGVTFAIAGTTGTGSSAHIRGVIEHAGLAAAFGLPKEHAHRALTLSPAQIFGLDEHLGSIEVGKSASMILTDKDILEVSSVIEKVWIDGRAADLNDKHKSLYERYRNRPKGK